MDIRKILGETQKTIKNTAPEAEKTIGHDMPGYKRGKVPFNFPLTNHAHRFDRKSRKVSGTGEFGQECDKWIAFQL